MCHSTLIVVPIYQVIVLAVVQGLTEFLPVSSTAHLYLTSWLLGWQAESLEFDIALHIGTLVAVLIYFFRDWLQIAAQGFGMRLRPRPGVAPEPRAAVADRHRHASRSACAGLLFNEQAETTWRNPFVMADDADRRGRADVGRRARRQAQARPGHAGRCRTPSLIGLAQALAIVPGTSRSGITITAGLFRGLDRGVGGALLLPALHPRHRRRRGQGVLRPGEARRPRPRHAAAVRGGDRGERADRLRW